MSTRAETGVRTLEIGPEAVDALVEFYDEPAWMRDVRAAAWERYTAQPFPSASEEAWRRTPPQRFPVQTLNVTLSPHPGSAVPACWHEALAPETMVAGTLVHCNGRLSRAEPAKGEAPGAVVLDDLHRALHTHGEVIRRHWMTGTATRPEFNKFAALNAALWQGGTFVYVPEGVKVSLPLQSLVAYDAGGSGMHRTLVVAEKGSRVTLVQDRFSHEREAALNVEVVEICAAEGAWVRYVSLQHWGAERHTVSLQNASLERDANLLWISGSLGGGVSKEFLRSDMLAPGARSLMQGFALAGATQHIDQSTYQHHRAADTYSDLLFRNVLREQARSVFYGMIRVETGAQGTQGFQANHNLLFDAARANSIPGLEIIANDVRCSHGATVSRIDPEQLFYLRARGIPRPEAEQLIVQGFLRPIVDRVPLAHLRQRLEEEIAVEFSA